MTVTVVTESGAVYQFLVEDGRVVLSREEGFTPSYNAVSRRPIGRMLETLAALPVIRHGARMVVERRNGQPPITTSPVSSFRIEPGV